MTTPRRPPHAAASARPAPDAAHRYERLISTIPGALYDYVRWPDGSSRFLYISAQCEDIFEHPAAAIIADPTLLWNMVHPDDLARLQAEDETANATEALFRSEVRIRLPSGGQKWIQLSSRPGPDTQADGRVWSGVILDITERKQVEVERDRALAELQTALAEVKMLSGFLPICMRCKKIRDDRGYWNQLEAYISEHSDAQFSHGVCPECADRYLAEFRESEKNRKPDCTAS